MVGNPPLLADFDSMDYAMDQSDLIALERLIATELRRFRRPDPVIAVEIGSWSGLSALAIAQSGVRLFCVDHWEGNSADQCEVEKIAWTPDEAFARFCTNVQGLLFDRVFPFRCESRLAASLWPNQVDIVYIDADPGYEHVKGDIVAWLPVIKNGGLLCGHGYETNFPGIMKAVGELGGHRVDSSVWWKRIIR